MQATLAWDAPTLRTAMMANPAIRVIDVRSPAEYESEPIPGSLNIPMSTLEGHVGRIRGAVGDPIVFVC
ncbi:MAG: rhodanese-like domain-containing protein [Chromatiaceae bacterium]|nr:MAG: rhodanese-like domain-containing protein [Chromatiaceae bacterium]